MVFIWKAKVKQLTLIKCPQCRRDLIEEVSTHACREVEKGKIEDGLFWVYDCEAWYPYKLHPESSPEFQHWLNHRKNQQNQQLNSNKAMNRDILQYLF